MTKQELYNCFREYQVNNDWFETVFLTSLIKRVLNNNNSKYPNQIIISEKQAGICQRYMTDKQSRVETIQGFSTFGSYQYETYYFKCYMRQRGKYFFFEIRNKIIDAKRELEGLEEYLNHIINDYRIDKIEQPDNHELLQDDENEINEVKTDIDFLINYINNYKGEY